MPANEVWGKVIFSEACVKNSVHGGGGVHGCWGGGACMVAGGVCGCQGACMVSGGACMVARGQVWLPGAACMFAGGVCRIQ